MVNKTSQSQKDKPACSHMWNFSLSCTVRPSGNRAGDTNAEEELLSVEKRDPAQGEWGKGLASEGKGQWHTCEKFSAALALYSNLKNC